MKRYLILLLLGTIFIGCKKEEATFAPQDMIREFYSIHKELDEFGYVVATLAHEKEQINTTYNDFADRFNNISTRTFYKEQADYLDYLKLYISQIPEPRLRRIVASEIVEIAAPTHSDKKAVYEVSINSSDFTFDCTAIEKVTDEEFETLINNWKLKGTTIVRLREIKVYYDRWIEENGGKGWAFGFNTKEIHRFTMIKENGSYKIDSFEIELLESELTTDYLTENSL